jgi:hypothetical protein
MEILYIILQHDDKTDDDPLSRDSLQDVVSILMNDEKEVYVENKFPILLSSCYFSLTRNFIYYLAKH